MKIRAKQKILFSFFALISFENTSKSIIRITNATTLQIGDNIAGFAPAKILSLKYNIPFYYNPFRNSEFLVLSDSEKKADGTKFDHRVRVFTEDDILKNLDKENVLFYTDILTKIEHIDPLYIAEVKRIIQPKQTPIINELPPDAITVALHIRKGNGGGEFYDGEQESLQYFDFDRNQVKYLLEYNNYPFEWEDYQRDAFVDKIPVYQTKFPPNQYYVDQLVKLISDLHPQKVFVQIFTDDKDPVALTDAIKNKVNNPNVSFHYENNRSSFFSSRIIQDLFNISRFDVLIRSQSYFARTAELMGNIKVVIYPLRSHWEEKKLIMDTIVIKGSIKQLAKKS